MNWKDEEKWIFNKNKKTESSNEDWKEYIKAIKSITLFFILFSLIIIFLIWYIK